jgi:septal ring factor EnvC (AmiA/AmiB activator)
MKRLIWSATVLAGVSLGTALVAGSLRAQEAKSLSDTVAKTVETQQQTQKKQEAWAEEKNDLAARYRAAKAQVDYLEKTKAFEQNEVSELDKGIAELNRRMIESAKLKDNLEDSLNVVVNHLDNFIKQDIPFLMDERHARIASVRDAIAKPEVSAAEKLRRVLEALQVEANYGNTVDVSQERIKVGTTTSPPTSSASVASRCSGAHPTANAWVSMIAHRTSGSSSITSTRNPSTTFAIWCSGCVPPR